MHNVALLEVELVGSKELLDIHKLHIRRRPLASASKLRLQAEKLQTDHRLILRRNNITLAITMANDYSIICLDPAQVRAFCVGEFAVCGFAGFKWWVG